MTELRELQACLDRLADTFVVLIFDRLKPGKDAREAFDYWKQCFEQAKLHPHLKWLRDKVDAAWYELWPHLSKKEDPQATMNI